LCHSATRIQHHNAWLSIKLLYVKVVTVYSVNYVGFSRKYPGMLQLMRENTNMVNLPATQTAQVNSTIAIVRSFSIVLSMVFMNNYDGQNNSCVNGC